MSDDEITPDDYRLDASPVNWKAELLVYDKPGQPASGAIVDITRELRVMYDLVVTSMDWGSGFLDAEDMETITRLAKLCDFEMDDTEVDYAYELLDGTPVSLTGVRLKDEPGRVQQIRDKYEGRDGYEIREEIHPTYSKFPAPEGDQRRVSAWLLGHHPKGQKP